MLALCLLSSVTILSSPIYTNKYLSFLILTNHKLDLQFRLVKLDIRAKVHGNLSKREEQTIKYQITKVQQSNKLVIIAAFT